MHGTYRITKIQSCWFQNCQLRSTTLADDGIMLECTNAWYIKITKTATSGQLPWLARNLCWSVAGISRAHWTTTPFSNIWTPPSLTNIFVKVRLCITLLSSNILSHESSPRSVGGCQAFYLASLVQEGELYRSSCVFNLQLTIIEIYNSIYIIYMHNIHNS